MSGLFLTAVVVLVFLVIFQIAKASEYVSVLKGEEKARKQSNRINGMLMLVFLISGLLAVYFCNEAFKDSILGESASDHGEKIDAMLYTTTAITAVVFFVTQILLFTFAYRFQEKEGRKAYYFPHNNTLELVWTSVPAVVLTVLVGFGIFYWFKITGPAPKDALVVEITGKQFGWIFRYSGKDGVMGKKYYKNINEKENNQLGLIWDDPATKDDIVVNNEMYIIKGQPVKLVINSRDVIHDVGLVHFRMKMDAVPGTPTTMWFTPKFTTAEMKEKTGNPDFEYEISCDQMCGKGHYSMKGVIKVVEKAEYDAWLAKQASNYALAFPAETAPAPTDSAAAKPMAAIN